MTPPVVIVPGLREHVAQHWQTLLAQALREQGRSVHVVPPMGRDALDCAARVAALEHSVRQAGADAVLVAHSAGTLTVAHWACSAVRSGLPVRGAVLAAPPDFETPMPASYPAIDALRAAGWLPLPRVRLPFRTVVALSSNDPLARFDRAAALARDWGAECAELGAVGHLNPASGYGPWPRAEEFIDQLAVAG
jgi:predicted alpha/beta hydrolase family esterase